MAAETNLTLDDLQEAMHKELQLSDPEISTLPHRFFFYGTCRDDAAGTPYAGDWTEAFAKGSKGFDARVYGFKMYQHKQRNFPFAIQTYNNSDCLIGRVMEFQETAFPLKLSHANYIDGYDPADPDSCFYSRIVVNAYLDADPSNKNGRRGTAIKAVSYFQKLGKSNLSECIEVPFNDWLYKLRQYPIEKQVQAEQQETDNTKQTNEEQKQTNDDTHDHVYPSPNAAANGMLGFERFKSYFYENFKFGQMTNVYFESLVKNDVNTLELLMECEDEQFLKGSIAMKGIHCNLFAKKVQKLKKEHKAFDEWLQSISMSEYLNAFVNDGILTFELFYKHCEHDDDVSAVIGVQNKKDARLMWTQTPKYLRQSEAQIEGQ